MMMRSIATAAFLCTALCGCQTDGQSAAPFALLSAQEARIAVVAGRSKYWKDPESIRDARIGVPYLCPAMIGDATCVCVEANAKNSFGGYTGTRPNIAFINSGRVMVNMQEPRALIDRCEAMQPFPELTGAITSR